jgi:ketosteroid isomerase-like protein
LTSSGFSFAAALLVAAPPARPPTPPSVAPVVEAERAFAQLAQEKGTREAFKTFIADDGLMFLPAPRRAKPLLEAGGMELGTIRWWPVYAGLAASGDLGFTTGPAVIGTGREATYGVFFTVWKRQADGRWRWVLDRGSRQAVMPREGPETPVVALPPAAPRRKGARAWSEVQAAEAALARDLAADACAGFLRVLAPDARLLRSGPPPAIGRAAIGAALAEEPRRLRVAALGGGVSAAGDLAYTYGTAAWTDAAGERSGFYVRIWQRRAGGWKLVVDETNARPEPRPD